MLHSITINIRVFSVCILLLVCVSAFAETVVVTAKTTPLYDVSGIQLQQRWLSQKLYINNSRVDIIDLPESNEIRQQFYKTVVKKTGRSLHAYWAKKIFSGKEFPPKVLNTSQHVVNWVSESSGRIGYIDSSYLNDNVKIIFSLPTPKGNKTNE